jgi:hypothetical protein
LKGFDFAQPDINEQIYNRTFLRQKGIKTD